LLNGLVEGAAPVAAAGEESPMELTALVARFIVKVDGVVAFDDKRLKETKNQITVRMLAFLKKTRLGRFDVAGGIWRLCWLLMLAVHVGAITESWLAVFRAGSLGAGSGALLRALALSGLAGFFVLKIVDVSWLRLTGGWRSKVAAGIVVALLHVSVVERATGIETDLSPAHVGVVLFAAGAIDSRRLLRLTAALRRLFVRVFLRIVPQHAIEQFAHGADHEQRPLLACAHLNALPLRAPPCA